jgi:hypothetical protein
LTNGDFVTEGLIVTLNITAYARVYVSQVSDRRLTSVLPNGQLSVRDDSANKAVILRCSDGHIAITFTGLGTLGAIRVDEWVVDALVDNGLCELPSQIAVEKFSQLATDWFETFRHRWRGEHTFTFAGWVDSAGSRRRRPAVWFVTNAKATDYSSFAPKQVATSAGGLYVTGWLPGFKRPDRRRLQAALRKSNGIDEIEHALVSTIRSVASHPEGTPVGKNCMSVTLSAEGVAVARFHPDGHSEHNFGPHVVWYAGGRNMSVKGIDHLPTGRYSLVFGDNAAIVRSDRIGLSGQGEQISRSLFQLKVTAAKYHVEPVIETEIVRVVEG